MKSVGVSIQEGRKDVHFTCCQAKVCGSPFCLRLWLGLQVWWSVCIVRLVIIDNKISWDNYAGPRFDNLYSHGNIIRNQEFSDPTFDS